MKHVISCMPGDQLEGDLRAHAVNWQNTRFVFRSVTIEHSRMVGHEKITEFIFRVDCVSFLRQDFLDVLEKRKETYERITTSVESMVTNSDPTTAASLQRQLDEVKEAWEQVNLKSEDEDRKLEDALKNAEELEKKITEMDSWLTQVHDQILSFDHVSSILDILEKQREKYKVRNVNRELKWLNKHLPLLSPCTMDKGQTLKIPIHQ